MSFTPGPWQVISGAVFGPLGITQEIASMCREYKETCTVPVERDANARLIAAAPDLYRELLRGIELAEAWLETSGDDNLSRDILDMKKAIAKVNAEA